MRGALRVLVLLEGVAAAAIIFYAASVDGFAFRFVQPLVGAVAVVLLFAFLWSLGAAQTRRGRLVWLLPPIAVVLLGVNLAVEAQRRGSGAVAISRGFFGMLRVVDRQLDDPLEARRILYHGAINHGFQFLLPERQMWHNSYFPIESGIGVALTQHPASAQQDAAADRPAGARRGHAADLLAAGRSHPDLWEIENWISNGTLPMPTSIGRRVYWHPLEFKDWQDRVFCIPKDSTITNQSRRGRPRSSPMLSPSGKSNRQQLVSSVT